MREAILIVESSSLVSQQYLEVFKNLEFECEIEKDGYAALGKLLEKNYHSLLVSSHASKIDGSTLITILKMLDSSNKKIPTILIYHDSKTSGKKRETTDGLADFCLFNDSKLLSNLEMTYLKIVEEK